MTAQNDRSLQEKRSRREEIRDAFAKWPPIVLMAALAGVWTAQIWLAHSRSQISFDLNRINEQIESVNNGIDHAHIEVQSRHAPAYVADVAEQLGFVKVDERPDIVYTDIPPTRMTAQASESISAQKIAAVQQALFGLDQNNELVIDNADQNGGPAIFEANSLDRGDR